MFAEKHFNYLVGLIAAAEPNDLRWRAVEGSHVGKVCILGNNYETVCLGILPDRTVISFGHAKQRT
jgi:hypothetical protein